jgi:hypothetical protein
MIDWHSPLQTEDGEPVTLERVHDNGLYALVIHENGAMTWQKTGMGGFHQVSMYNKIPNFTVPRKTVVNANISVDSELDEVFL